MPIFIKILYVRVQNKYVLINLNQTEPDNKLCAYIYKKMYKYSNIFTFIYNKIKYILKDILHIFQIIYKIEILKKKLIVFRV